MVQKKVNQPDFGNWVPLKMIVVPAILGLACLGAGLRWWPLLIPAALFCAIAVYFAVARWLFSARGGNEIDSRAFQQTAVRAMLESKSNAGPSAATSIMKNAGTRMMQDRAELILEVMGHQGLGWEGSDFTAEELGAVRGWLGGKATTIYGGSQEVQNNIISKRILGLPEAGAAR